MTPRKEKALQALLVCPTKAAAAKMADIGETTLRAYLKDPEFQGNYRAAVGEMLEDATRQAQRGISPALDTLQTIAADAEQPAQARIQAARSTLEYGLKLTEQHDILAQLEDLEQWRNGQ